MDDFFNNLLSFKWWITIVVGSILLDFIKDFTKSKISKYYKNAYQNYQRSVELNNIRDKEKIESLSNDFKKYIVFSISTLFRHISYSVLSIIILMMANLIFSAVSFDTLDDNADLIKETPFLYKSGKVMVIVGLLTILFSMALSFVLLYSFIIKDRSRHILHVVTLHYLRKK